MTNLFWKSVVAVCFVLWSDFGRANPIRSIALDPGIVGDVKTALGFSTILEFDEPILNVVAGDQDAFKVEFSGQSLAVKPIVKSVSTNLFVTTANHRFTFKVVTVEGRQVDYLVKVSAHQPARPGVESAPRESWKEIGREATANGVHLKVEAAKNDASYGHLMISFSLDATAEKKRRITRSFEPGDLLLKQGKTAIPIEHLYIESLMLGTDPVHGQMVVNGLLLKAGRLATLSFDKGPSVKFSLSKIEQK